MTTLLLVATAVAAPPSLDEPHRTGQSQTADSAVVIGIEAYPFLPDVPYAKRDADAFRDLMLYTRGVPSERIHRLEGGSREMILDAVSAAATATGPDGTVWIYYAGHGAADPATGERMLLGDDTRPDPKVFASRSVHLGEIEAAATSEGARMLAVLDTCYAGAGRDGAELLPGTRFAVPSYAIDATDRTAIWTATAPSELSGPLDAAEHGAFTYFVVGALRGWADGELDGKRDGMVSHTEAQAYVTRALRSVGTDSQTPSFDGSVAGPLSQGTESPPDLSTIDGTVKARGPASPPTVEVGGSADLDLASLASAAAAREQTVGSVKDKAAAEWRAVWALASGGSAEGGEAIALYLEKYGEGVQVDVDGRSEAIEVPEARIAAAWKELYGTEAIDRYQSVDSFTRWEKKEAAKAQSIARKEREPSGNHWWQFAAAADGAYNGSQSTLGGGGGIDVQRIFPHDGGGFGLGVRAGALSTIDSGVGTGERLIGTVTAITGDEKSHLLATVGGGITGLSAGSPMPVTELSVGWQGMDVSSDGGLVLGVRVTQQQLFASAGMQHITMPGVYIGSYRGRNQ